MKAIYTYFISALLILLALFIYQNRQEHLTYANGLASDGLEYMKMAEDFAQGRSPQAKAPFVYRVASSYLASLNISTSNSPSSSSIESFYYINLLASILAILLLNLLLNLYSSNYWLNLLAIGFFIFHWAMPLRFFMWDAVSPDGLYWVILLLGLIVIKLNFKHTVWILAVLSLVGVFTRETALFPALLYFLLHNNLRDIINFKINYKSAVPLVIGAISLLALKLLIKEANNYEYGVAVWIWIYKFSPIAFLNSIFKIYGLLIPVLFLNRKIILSCLKANREISYFIIIILIFSIIGGADKERFITWTYPTVSIILINFFTKVKFTRIFVILLSMTLLLTLRVFFLLPIEMFDFMTIPFLSYNSSSFNVNTLFYTDNSYQGIILFIEYAFLSLGIYKFRNSIIEVIKE